MLIFVKKPLPSMPLIIYAFFAALLVMNRLLNSKIKLVKYQAKDAKKASKFRIPLPFRPFTNYCPD